MGKSLSVSELRKLDRKYNEKVEVHINDYTLTIDKNFRKSKVAALLAEIVEKAKFATINKIDIFEIFPSYCLFLAIKYFTSLQVPDDLGKQLEIMNILIDNNFLDKIIEAFPEEQMKFLREEIEKAKDNLEEFANMYDDEKLENEDVLRGL